MKKLCTIFFLLLVFYTHGQKILLEKQHAGDNTSGIPSTLATSDAALLISSVDDNIHAGTILIKTKERGDVEWQRRYEEGSRNKVSEDFLGNGDFGWSYGRSISSTDNRNILLAGKKEFDRDNLLVHVFKIESIQNRSIALDPLPPACEFSNFQVPFTPYGFSEGTTFQLEISMKDSAVFDPNNPFNIIGTGKTSPINASIDPNDLPGNYFLRIVADGVVSDTIPFEIRSFDFKNTVRLGSSLNTKGRETAYDIDRDNISLFTVGNFSGTASFGTTSLRSSGGTDGYLLKYSPDGQVKWAKKFGGRGNDGAFGVKSWYEPGFVYVTGSFSGTARFDHLTVKSWGGTDMFLAKYDTAGTIQWVRTGGGFGNDAASAVTINAYEIVVTGSFSYLALFDWQLMFSKGHNDVFVARYDLNGNLLGAKRFGGHGNDIATSISGGNGGGLFITGYFNSEIAGLTASGGYDIFTLKMDDAANLLWAKKAGGPGDDYGRGMIYAPLDNSILVTGSFSGTADFSGISLTSAGGRDMFLAAYSQDGALAYAVRKGNEGHDEGRDLGIDYRSGNAVVAGWSYSPEGQEDIVLTKFASSSGVTMWERRAGGPGNDRARGIIQLNGDDFFVTGNFEGEANFGSQKLISHGAEDIFISKLNCGGPSSPSESIMSMTIPEKDDQLTNNIFIYPNPGDGVFNLKSLTEDEIIEEAVVVGFDGSVLEKKIFSLADQKTIDISNRKKGLYLIKIKTNQNQLIKRIEIK